MKRILLSAAIFSCTFLQLSAQSYLTQVKPEGKKEWGYMNEKGEIAIEPLYRKCYQFSEDGRAAVFIDKKLVLLKTEGTQIPTAGSVVSLGPGKGFADGLMPVKNKERKMGYLNIDGEVAIELNYEEATEFHAGYAMVKKGGVAYVLNTKGEEVQAKYQSTQGVKPFQEGLSPVRNADGKWGFINTQGELVIEPAFMGVGYFSNGLAWARTENKTIGYINTKGEWVIPAQFSVAKDFDTESGMARVKMGDNWMYTDATGALMTVDDSNKWENFHEGLAMGRKGDLIGFFNKEGKWVIEPAYEAARHFKNGYAAVRLNGKWGFVNKAGEVVISCDYAAVKDMEKAMK